MYFISLKVFQKDKIYMENYTRHTRSFFSKSNMTRGFPCNTAIFDILLQHKISNTSCWICYDLCVFLMILIYIWIINRICNKCLVWQFWLQQNAKMIHKYFCLNFLDCNCLYIFCISLIKIKRMIYCWTNWS